MTPLPGIELGSHERESYTRSGLRPFSWGLGKQCTPRQRPIPVWQLPRRTGVHLPTPAAPIHSYPHRRPLPPINARRATIPPSSPTISHSHHRWHLPLRDFLPRASIPNRRLLLGPQRLDVDWEPLTYLKTYRLHLHRGRFTNPFRFTPLSWTRQASSPRERSAPSTGSSRISADGIYPADLRAFSTPRRSPR